MVDILKNEHLRAQFVAWRSASAAEEEDHLATTLLINDYVNGKKLIEIQEELRSASSPHFISFGPKRLQGAVLYAKLVIEGYRQKEISEEEKLLLAEIGADIGHLYTTPTNNPKTRIDKVIANISLWLERYALDSNNKNQAKNLCRALYAALKITELRNATLDDTLKHILKTSYDINVDEMRAALQTLLDKTAAASTNLDELIRKQEEDILAELNPLIRHFNASYFALIQEEQPEEERLERLHQALEEDEANFARLITLRENRTRFNEQLNHASLLLRALEENDEKIVGRQYALELVAAHRKSYDNLIENSVPEIRRLWEARQAQLEHPDAAGKIKSGIQYGVSTITFLPTIAFRAFAPAFIKRTVQQYAPSTADSQFKEELMALAQARQLELNRQLQAINNDIKTVSAHLTHRLPAKEEVTLLLETVSIPGLKQLRISTSTLKDLVKEYQELRAMMNRNQQKLHEINALNNYIDSFVAKHNGFWVWLSNLFAKISSIFKTDTARKLDEVLTIKKELQDLKKDYEAQINQKHMNITENFLQVSSEIKEDLETLLPAHESAPSPPRVYQVDNIHHSFSRIRRQHQRIINPEETLASPVPVLAM
ncbi:hypothetical protein [Legionella nagasakiensis]|uniref:hypothetical protein n=1 Tax=Legionella nagasakiensis TaxID=535290 RepID=UPI0010564E68|nr:hypothetical protein [Legionella nagasakiensis]